MAERIEHLALVRCIPGSKESERLQRWFESVAYSTGMIFFQAGGVEHAAMLSVDQWNRPGWHLLVCQGSWQRRHRDGPASPFEPGSLISFFSALESTETTVECFGASA